MGLFDFFKKDKAKGEQSKAASAAAKWAEAAGNKRAQNYDRQEALHELANMGTAEAAEALLEPDAAVRDEPLPSALLEPLFDD
jgi:hypothetical protein